MGKNEMVGRRRKSAQLVPAPPSTDDAVGSDGAFDVWLNRGLHQLYDNVAHEPIPDELLNIIEADRARADQARDGPGVDAATPGAAALGAGVGAAKKAVPGSH